MRVSTALTAGGRIEVGSSGRAPPVFWPASACPAEKVDARVKSEPTVDPQSRPDPVDGQVSLDSWLVKLRPALTAFLLRKLQDPADLGDALQETSLRAWNYALGTELRSPVSLCFRIAENVAIDFSRNQKKAHYTGRIDEAEQMASDDPGPESRASARQELELVKRVIGMLPPGCRHVFLLSRSAGMTNAEIAEQCGVSIKLVEKQISRALRELRQKARVLGGAQP